MDDHDLARIDRETRLNLSGAAEFVELVSPLPPGSALPSILDTKRYVLGQNNTRLENELRAFRMQVDTGQAQYSRRVSDLQGMLAAARGMLATKPAGRKITVPPQRLPRPASWSTMRSRIATLPGIGRIAKDRGPGNKELEALDELDQSDAPPSGMRPVSRPSKGRYSFQAVDWRSTPDPPPAGMRPMGGPPKTAGSYAFRIDDDRPPARRARTALGSGVVSPESDGETGWDIAVRRSEAGRNALAPGHASEARKRIRSATSPAFAAALDRGVNADLLTRFARGHPDGVDAGKLRAAFAEAANRAFVLDFVRLVDGRPPAAAQDIALGATIAVAIAQAAAKYPIVPPAAIAPMAVLVHRALGPQLAMLARMAATVASAPAPAPLPAASRATPAHAVVP